MCWCDFLFGAMVVWAGRLVCPTKWEINNRQTPNGAILLCQALFFFFIFFQKPNQSSKTYLEEISSKTTNSKPFDSIFNSENHSLFWIHRKVLFLQSHCFDFTLPFCRGFSLVGLFIVLTPSDVASATLSLINFFEKYCKLNNNKTMCKSKTELTHCNDLISKLLQMLYLIFSLLAQPQC